MRYPKPWKSYSEQLALLQSRGMTVNDTDRALDYLERIGYYRLSGYWFAFRERSGTCCPLSLQGTKPAKIREDKLALDTFKPGTTFQNAVDLYVFDKKLRLLVLDAIERIEIALRVDVSHTLGRTDPFAYLNPSHFHRKFSEELDPKTGLTPHHAWLNKQAQLIKRSKEEFVQHNKTKYGLPLAMWVACEVWDFGTLSSLFSGMHESDQDAIAHLYGVRNGRTLSTWFRSLNYLRNVCAHHSRLWNRNIVDQPKLPSAQELGWTSAFIGNAHAQARCFLLLKMTCHLLMVINPHSSWPQRMRDHLLAFPDLGHLDVNLAGMGAPENWQDIWNTRT